MAKINIKKSTIIISLILVGLFFVGQNVLAYNNNVTHPLLTREIIKYYNQYFNKNISSGDIEIMVNGSIKEDEPGVRTLNHFYDPISGKKLDSSNAGLLSSLYGFLMPFSKSAKEWANDSSAQANFIGQFYANSTFDPYARLAQNAIDSQTTYTWNKALYKYITGDKQSAFESLGHVLHLLEDMAVPAHTRNDHHLRGDPYEIYVGQNLSGNIDINGIKNPYILSSLDNYFINLATYSNNNFYSKETIGLQSGYKLPEVNPLNTKTIDGFYYSVKNDLLGEYFLLNQGESVNSYLISTTLVATIDDSLIYKSYWSHLSKQAISYGAGLVDLFFKEADRLKNDQAFLSSQEETLFGKIVGAIGDFLNDIGGVFGGGNSNNNSTNNTPTATPTPPLKPIITPTPKPEVKGVFSESGNNVSASTSPTPIPIIIPTPSPKKLTPTPITTPIITPTPSPTVIIYGGGYYAGVSSSVSNDVKKINICHKADLLWYAQEIEESAWSAHQAHGDFLYNGPIKSNGKPDDNSNDWCSANLPTPSPIESPTITPMPTPTPSEEPIPTPIPTPTPLIVISEFLYNAIGSDTGKEFIELYNAGNEIIDLDNWSLRLSVNNSTSTDALAIFGRSELDQKTIKSKGFLLIGLNNYSADNYDSKMADIIRSASIGQQATTTYEIQLLDKNDNLIDSVIYVGNSINEGKSLERKANLDSTIETMVYGIDKYNGNSFDTDGDLLDFIIRENPQPQNFESLLEPRQQPPRVIDLSGEIRNGIDMVLQFNLEEATTTEISFSVKSSATTTDVIENNWGVLTVVSTSEIVFNNSANKYELIMQGIATTSQDYFAIMTVDKDGWYSEISSIYQFPIVIEPTPTSTPIPTPVFFEGFEDYSLGDLKNQGGWIREEYLGFRFSVGNNIVYEGEKSVFFDFMDSGGYAIYSKSIDVNGDGIFSFKLQAHSAQGPGGFWSNKAYLEFDAKDDNPSNYWRFGMVPSDFGADHGEICYQQVALINSHGEHICVPGAWIDAWYNFQIEFSQTNGIRARVNENEWSTWQKGENWGEYTGGLGKITITAYGGPDHKYYLDNLEFSETLVPQ